MLPTTTLQNFVNQMWVCVQASKFNMDNFKFHLFVSIFKKFVKIKGNDFLLNEGLKNEKKLVCT